MTLQRDEKTCKKEPCFHHFHHHQELVGLNNYRQ